MEENLNSIADGFRALAHPIRLKILNILREGPRCVSFIEERTGTTQSNISQHLSLMKKAGVLSCRREGNQINYRVENWRIYQLMDTAGRAFEE